VTITSRLGEFDLHLFDEGQQRITNRGTGAVFDKADPLALCTEVPPATASVIWDLTYDWGDEDWMAGRGALESLPIATQGQWWSVMAAIPPLAVTILAPER